MDILQIINSINIENIIPLVFKILAVFFSLFYIFYAVVIYRQTQVMNKTLQEPNHFVIAFISLLQIIAGIILFLYAILL